MRMAVFKRRCNHQRRIANVLNIPPPAPYSAAMEEAVHPGTESGGGYEPVTVRQFTVFLENRVGRLTLLVRALEEGTSVVAMAIEESADSALARVICSSSDAAREVLKSHEFSFGEVEVLIVSLPKRSRPLMGICSVLLSAEINIHNAYPLLICPGDSPALVIYCDDSILAAQLLMRKGYRMIGESDFQDPRNDTSGNGN
jgi:hypothetical protein